MKIVQINSVCGQGSTGKIAVDIAKSLEAEGHQCLIAYGRGSAQNYTQTIKIGSPHTVQVHGVLSRITDKHGLFSKKATKKLIREIENFDPDVIHLHNIHGYYLHYPTLFSYLKACDKPVIWTLHDCWSYTGHCAYYTYSGCTKFQTGCEKCPSRNEYPKAYVDNSRSNFALKKQFFQGVDNLTLVTPSHWLKEEVGKSFLADYPVQVIYNGINLDVFKKISIDKQNQKKIILGVANVWDRRKGLDTFVQLAQILPEDYEIILIGLNQKQIQSLPHNIIGIERTSNIEELVEYYNKAIVFLNPTLEDNYPTTNLEAQACGTPVITFDVGGTKETLKSEQSTTLHSKCSVIEIFQTIRLHEKYRTNIDTVLLSKEASNDEYLLLYTSVLKNKLRGDINDKI